MSNSRDLTYFEAASAEFGGQPAPPDIRKSNVFNRLIYTVLYLVTAASVAYVLDRCDLSARYGQ